MGRRPRGAEPATHKISFRLTDNEAENLSQNQDRRGGVNTSDYFRNLLEEDSNHG